MISADDEDLCQMDTIHLHHPNDHAKKRSLTCDQLSEVEPLMEEIIRTGEMVYDLPSLEAIRQTRARDMDRLYPGVKRIMNPHEYHVSLTQKLWDLKQDLVHDLADGKEDNQSNEN